MKKFVIIVLCVAILSINLSVVSFAADTLVPPFTYPLEYSTYNKSNVIVDFDSSLFSGDLNVFYSLSSSQIDHLNSIFKDYLTCDFSSWYYSLGNAVIYFAPTDNIEAGGFDIHKTKHIVNFIINKPNFSGFDNMTFIYPCFFVGRDYSSFYTIYNGDVYLLRYSLSDGKYIFSSAEQVKSTWTDGLRIAVFSDPVLPDISVDDDCCSQLSARVDELEEKLNTTSSTVENMQNQLNSTSSTVENMQNELNITSSTVENMQNELNNFFRFLVAVL